MTKIPDYVTLGGDEDGNVTAVCYHDDCQKLPTYGFAFWGVEEYADGLPWFTMRGDNGGLAGFVKAIAEHRHQHEQVTR